MIKDFKGMGTIAVLMGGCSSERTISIKSGTAIYEALQGLGCLVVPLDLQSEREEDVIDLLKKNNVDLVFIALHGKYGEDGQLQGILERNGIAFTGTGSQASQRAMNKISTQDYLSRHGIMTPAYQVFLKGDTLDVKKVVDEVGLPLVVKPANEGSSIGITILEKIEGLDSAIDMALRYGDQVLLEKYIKGKEITAGILGQEALELVEIRPHEKFFDFDAKYKKGLTDYIIPAEISVHTGNQIKTCALEAFRLLDCRDFARADFILDDDGLFYFLEMNTIPGFTATSLLPKAAHVAGYDFPDLCVEILNAAHTRHGPRNKVYKNF